MPINELIAQGIKPAEFESPVNQLAKVLQIKAAQQNIARGEMEQDQYRQGLERKNKLTELMGGLGSNATDEQRSAALKSGGYFAEADALDKSSLERRKIGSESSARDIDTIRKRIDIAGQAFNQVRQSPTLENANAVLDYLGANGVYTQDQIAQYKAQVASNPADIGRLADIAFRSALDAKEQLAKNTSENLGGNMAYNSTDPLTGRVTQTGMAPITQSADNAASNARQAAEGAANRAVQIRGQNLVNARSKESTQQGNKPPAGYRYTPNGDLEAIPGGPADLKAQAVSGLKAAGVADVDSAIAVLRDAYDRLEKGGGITSTEESALSNVASAISSSGVGQAVGRALGTNNQSARNDIAMTRPALLAALMKATGMSAKQMDSNAELKLWMATATDPTLDVESNRRALANIERKYLGTGAPQQPPGKPSGLPIKVTNDNEYNALPSGSIFIGPDGKTRRKP